MLYGAGQQNRGEHAREAAAQAGGLFINAVFLDINPADMPKFMEAIKENGAASVKEPGCRTFNIHVSAKEPNQVFRDELEGALVPTPDDSADPPSRA